jgi:hypothetical protein
MKQDYAIQKQKHKNFFLKTQNVQNKSDFKKKLC